LDNKELSKNLDKFKQRKEYLKQYGLESFIKKFEYKNLDQRFYQEVKKDKLSSLLFYIKINQDERDFSDHIATDIYFFSKEFENYNFYFFI